MVDLKAIFKNTCTGSSAREHASTLAGALITVTSIHKLVFRLHDVSVIYDIFLEYRSVSKGDCHGYG